MFCTVKGLESLGVAKIIEAFGSTWLVEYFDGPATAGRETYKVNKLHVIKRTLGPNTRVYFHDAGTDHWLVGRILKDIGDGVEVRFADKMDVLLDYDQVFVRWKQPIRDPVEFLARSITETPQYSEARRRFLDSYVAQRRATGGISALLSSAIELNPHQIHVIRRVLSDPSQRYLLADEVGLGKTVEAGVIIRQAVLDDPRYHKVVVLVPPTLVRQWRQELVVRFGLEIYLDDSVLVLPQEASAEVEEALQGANMLVIDEAHHIASPSQSDARTLYELVCRAARKTERVLLLSATPVLRNEVGFLRMLHLLDPVVYDFANEEAFRAKIVHRQALAEAVATLDPQNVLHLEPVLDDLVERLPNDCRLVDLVGNVKCQLAGFPEEDDPDLNEAIRILRAHLSETYRLHRRILRNRRKYVKWLTPNRRGSVVCRVPKTGWHRIESALENWRISAVVALGQRSTVSNPFVDFYWDSIQALLENPGQLPGICKARLAQVTTTGISQVETFEGEFNLLHALDRAADNIKFSLQARVEACAEEIQSLLAKQVKVVVFCTNVELADLAFDYLRRMLPSDAVVRHEVEEVDEYESAEPAWIAFQSNPATQVIVCDRRAEEGINLQGGRKVIVHFDLPFNPNRVEQRIGRLDRYSSGQPIQSIVVLDDECGLQVIWYSLLSEGFGVFERSISSLQYLVEDQLTTLKGTVFLDGVEAISSLAEALHGPNGLAAKELRLIDQQDGLDELSPQPEIELDSMFDVDDNWKEIRGATHSWVVGTLRFGETPVSRKDGENPVDPPFRFRYAVPGGGGDATLIPLSGFLSEFLGALDYEAPGVSSRQPLSFAHSYHRKTAIKYGVRPLRYGSEFVEAMKSFSDLDDRGRSFACWRHVFHGLSDNCPKIYFRFSFLIECDVKPATTVLEAVPLQSARNSMSSIGRRGDSLFPPMVEHIWIDEDREEPDSEFIATLLDSPYDKNGVSGRYKDKNLKTQRLLELIENMPDLFGNWSERCFRLRDRALAILRGRTDFRERILSAVARAKGEDEIRFAQLATRIQYLPGLEAEAEREQLAFEEKLSAALSEGIADPSIRIDVAGAIVLTSVPYEYAIEATA